MKMRILFLLTQDLESPSGLGRYWPLARELADLGYQVRIAALHSNYSELKQRNSMKSGVEIHYVAPMHVLKKGDQKRYYSFLGLLLVVIRATVMLSWAALRYPAEIVLIGKPHPMNGLAGLLSKMLRGNALIVDCDDFEAGLGRFQGRWQRDVVAFFEKRIPRAGKKVTTHTHFNMDQLISWGIPQERIFYLPNGIDPQRFSEPDPALVKAEYERLGLAGKKIVAYIGSLSMPSHPVHLLLEAFQIIAAEDPDTCLLIVGGGDNLEDLQDLARRLEIAEQCRFVGRVPPESVPVYYSLAHVCSDPIYNDDAARGRSPLKLFEAWIMGVPFVSMSVGERPYLLGDPPAGILVSDSHPATLAAGLRQALFDETIRAEITTRGAERVQEYYWSGLARSLDREIRDW